jgi:hypothetical protein
MSERSLLCINIQTAEAVWNRTLLSDYVPSQQQLDIYYKIFCGFADATVTINTIAIPADFNAALLSVSERCPTQFPVNDLQTNPGDHEKRTKYAQFIQQVCDMERSRASLNIFNTTRAVHEPSESWTTTDRQRSVLLQKRAWVNELLASLQTEEVCESADIVPIEDDTTVVHAWVITPAATEIRNEHGSKIILSHELGREWEPLFGTLLFPDFVVSRRVSTSSWAFQHTTSDTMLRSMLDWYIVSQDATVVAGVSSWIYQADKDLGMLMSTFKKVKVNERLLPNASSDGLPNIFKLLSTVESQLLASQHELETVVPVPADVFYRYIHYLCRSLKIPKESYQNVEMVTQILSRWERGNMGFKPEVLPLISSWNEVWSLCMGEFPCLERVRHFIRTLDAWDPVEAMVFSHAQKSAIANEWILMYIENEVVAEPKSRVRSTNLHVRVKEWCTKYLPDTVFPTYFTPMTIGPIFTRRGYNSIKQQDGRHTHGIRYKNEEFNTQESPPPAEKKPRKVAVKVTTTETIHIGTI